MATSASNTRDSNYRPPHVRVVAHEHGISPGREDAREDAEEEQEWSDDSDSQGPSHRFRRGTSPFDSRTYDENFNEMQNRIVKRMRAQPTQDNSHTPDPEYGPGPYRRYSAASSNAPGGQAVPYGPYHRPENLVGPYPEQLYNTSPQYYPPHQQIIPPPPQFYPPTNVEIDNLRQEIEYMKTESRERERRRIEKEQAEESRKKKRQAELRQKRKQMEEKEALKMKYEAEMQKMQADYDKKLESAAKAAGHRDQPADLHRYSSDFLPSQPAAGHYGYGYANSAAPERHAPPNRWFGGQGPSTQYHNDQPSMDDLYSQLGGMKRCLYEQGRIIGTLLPHEQWTAGHLVDGEYHPPYGPVHPMLQPPYYPLAAGSNSYQPDYLQLIRQPRMRRGGPYGRGPSPSAAVFSGIEEPVEDVENRRNSYNFRRYADDGDGGDENLAPATVAAHYDEQHSAGNTSKKVRKRQPPLHRRPGASGNNNAMRAAPYGSKVAARRLDTEEEDGGIASGHSSDASDEVEECKHRPNPYAGRPDARFGREVFQARGGPSQPFDQFVYGGEDQTPRAMAPTPPLSVDEYFVVRPRLNRVRR